jgi:hypothetical protein
MWDSRRENRIFVRILLASLLLVAVLTVLYLLFSNQIITNLYTGKRVDLFGMHLHPEEKDLAEYIQEGNQKFLTFVVVGFPLTFVCLFLLYKLFRFLFSKIDAARASEIRQPQSTLKHDWLLAAFIYTILTCVYFYPCLGSISQSLIGPPEDNMQTYWALSWGYDRVLHGTGSLTFVNDVFYPEGSSFYYEAWSFYNQVASSLLRLFFNQTTSYNLLILLTFPLAGIGAFLLIKYLLKNPYLAMLGGFLFAFNPSHVERALHHLNITSIQFVPLFVLFFVKTVRNEGKFSLALASLFLLLNALCDWNYLVLGFWLMAFSYIYLAIRRRRVLLCDLAQKGATILGSTALLLLFWLVPMIAQGLRNPGAAAGHNTYVADLAGLLIPSTHHLAAGLGFVKAANASCTGNTWEAAAYLGIVTLIIVAVAWRHILRQTAKYLIGALAFLIMALGAQPHFLGKMLPIALPDRLVMLLPFLGNVRAPSRFVVYVYLFWSIVVVLSLDWILRAAKTRRKSIVLAVSIVLLLLLDYSFIRDKTTAVSVPACYEIMVRGGERYGVLDLPSGYVEVDHYMMYQSFHRLPIVQGWVSRKIGMSLIDRLEFNDLDRQRQQLVESRVKYVVIHKVLLAGQSLDPFVYARYYQNVFEDGQSIVYKVY